MLSRADFIQVIAEVEELLRGAEYSQDEIDQLKLNALIVASFDDSSRESYIRAFDKIIANQLGSIVAELN